MAARTVSSREPLQRHSAKRNFKLTLEPWRFGPRHHRPSRSSSRNTGPRACTTTFGSSSTVYRSAASAEGSAPRAARGARLVEAQGSTYPTDSDGDGDGDSEEARTLRPLQPAACTYRIAFGPRAGQKVFTVKGAMPRDPAFAAELCADVQGFSLHAGARWGAGDRRALEQLCRSSSGRPWPTNACSATPRGSPTS